MEHFYLLKTLCSLSLAGTGLALLLMLLGRVAGKRVSSRFVYLAWLLVLLRFILPAPGLLSMPVPDAAPAAHTVAPRPAGSMEDTPSRSYYDGTNPDPGGIAAAVTEIQPLPDAADSEETAPVVPSEAVERTPLPAWTLLFWVWAAGTVCAAAWNLIGYIRFRRALYRTLLPAREEEAVRLYALHPRPWPALYRSGAVTTPLLLGLLRPVIVLPDRAYTPEMLDGILRHELTHYRRGDLIMKWFAAAVFCVHWFNPLVYLFRGEIDRACELSCDARLLRDMDVHEKQCYGELLLTLAADKPKPLPRRVVAVSFATEKRNLKERLIQIMTFKKKGWAAFAAMLVALALLVGCAVAMGPATVPSERETQLSALVQDDGGNQRIPAPSTPMPVRAEENDAPVITVDSVDDFLAALGSNRTIILAAGEYNLTQASGYGGPGTEAYSWTGDGDGYELVIDHVENLTILGEGGAEKTSIVTEPRYANVLRFEDCRDVALGNITAGHTLEQGFCTGGVLYYNGCDNMMVSGCDLYGCGTVGITAYNCRKVVAVETTIRECSYGAILASNCYDVRFTDGKIYDCGLKSQNFSFIESIGNTGFVVFNTEIYNNDARLFLFSAYSDGVELRGCRIYNNQFGEGIRISGQLPLIDGCEFGENALVTGLWYVDPQLPAVDRDGSALSVEALLAMEWAEYTDAYDGPKVGELPAPPFELDADGRKVFRVTTADDFLAAIGSDRTIYLDAALFDLSAAENYGGYGGRHYYWQSTYDGPGLVITGVENLRIIGQGRDKTNLETLPRYADVLSFLDCYAVTVQGLTVGHTLGAGSCAGDVISFRNCGDCEILDCGLFGCGVNGINAYDCQNLLVKDTEIYECSGYGAVISSCFNTVFEGCSIRDCTHNTLWVGGDGESDVTWDGEAYTAREI